MNMTQEEVARKCSSAPAVCGFGKCPFLDVCNYSKSACVMKHIAMMLRANLVELNKKETQINVMKDIVKTLCAYEDQLEYQNKQYHDLYAEYQAGFKPEPKKRKARRRVTKRNIAKCDGNPVYEDTSGFREGKPEEVII